MIVRRMLAQTDLESQSMAATKVSDPSASLLKGKPVAESILAHVIYL
jgi:hypothetical protein